ncbi:hypothetical protein RHGRI_030054 [Rhododendron griersonianum]|uniref:RNA helicase n=1 Tax=Rhododendron griersonianum TaxID=479676 RepID=A0AAV6INM8_9ERIC|nr:hypothetical protein RHGRI_030054 [Rhododendron griersonianum]
MNDRRPITSRSTNPRRDAAPSNHRPYHHHDWKPPNHHPRDRPPGPTLSSQMPGPPLFTVELRCRTRNFPKSDLDDVVSHHAPKVHSLNAPASGPLALSLHFRYWTDALEATVDLWETKLRGAHSFTPRLMPSRCDMNRLTDRLMILFTEHVEGLLHGDLVQTWERKLGCKLIEISLVKHSLGKHNRIGVYEELMRKKSEKESEKGLIEKRIDEFKAAMECVLGFLEGRLLVDDFKVLRLSLPFDWDRLHCLIKRECRRLEDRLPIYAFRGEILREIYNQQVEVELVGLDCRLEIIVEIVGDSGGILRVVGDVAEVLKVVMVLIGETGSGKSTQLVQFLADSGVAGNGSIICTQPRKIAAISLAQRVQEESCGCYQDNSIVSFPSYIPAQQFNSKVIYMTDHCLLQHFMKDKNLSGISCIIVDEAHERSLNTDLLLTLIKNLLCHRHDLRLIIMSATADANQLAEYFFGCGTFHVEGRNFPVDITYVPCASSERASDSASIASYASDVVSSEQDKYLKNAILSSLSENVAMYSGYDQLGYEVALTGKHVRLHPSCSLLIFGQRPSWVVFGDILSISNQYLVTVTAFDYEYLPILYPPPLFDVSKMESQKLQVRVLTGFGCKLLKTFCRKVNNYVSHVRTVCMDERIGIEVSFDRIEIQLFASSRDMDTVSSLLNEVLDYERKWLQNDCMEKYLYHGGPGLSPPVALFGAGAEIRHLELEKRCLTVDVFHSDVNTVDDKELLLFLERNALSSICAVQKFSGIGKDSDEKEKWGRVTFITPEAAMKASEFSPIEFNGSLVRIIPSRSTFGGDHKMFSSAAVRAKVSWPCKLSKGLGFVRCNRYDVTRVVDDLSNLLVGEKFVCCEPSTKFPDSVKITGFDRGLSEAEILDVLRSATDRRILGFSLVRGEAVENPPCSACEEALLRELSPFMPKRNPHGNGVRVQVFQPEPKVPFMAAEIMFDGSLHLEAAKALEQIEGKVLPGCLPWQKIKCQQLFHSSVSCPAPAYLVIKDRLDFLLASFKRRKGAECYLHKNENGSYRVKISANATKTVAELRRPLEQLMGGKTIEQPSLTPPILHQLFSRDGIILMKSIQRETGTYILFGRYTLTVRIFGSLKNVDLAEHRLVKSLVNLHESKQLEIHLRGGAMPPDLMKEVVKKFGPDLHGLKEKFPDAEFSLNSHRHVIAITGDKEVKQKVEDAVNEIAQMCSAIPFPSAQGVENGSGDGCPICLCEVEEGYRLESCGHLFCCQCLVEQCESAIKSQDSFPIRCAREGCGAHVLLTDLRYLLSSEKLEELFRASLGAYVALSAGNLRFCPSPDCPSVYQVAGPGTEGKPFVCGACYVETCTRCHVEYHPFVSCEKYREFKEDPDLSLKEWCKGKEEHVKPCPVCGYTIEKIEGCNHIECRCGKHICWVCLEFFGTSDDCYVHLRSIHLAII